MSWWREIIVSTTKMRLVSAFDPWDVFDSAREIQRIAASVSLLVGLADYLKERVNDHGLSFALIHAALESSPSAFTR